MTEVLTLEGYQVTVLTLPYGTDIEKLTIKRVLKLPFASIPPIGPSFTKLLYSILLFFYALKLSKNNDLIHGVEEGAMIGGLAGLLTGVPYISDVDSCMVTQIRDSGYSLLFCDKVFSAIETFFLKRAKAAITVCEALTRRVRVKAPELPVYQIEDFPLDESLVVSSSKYEELRCRFPGKKILLYTGNLEGYQGADLMIRAFHKFLNSEEANTILLIVGGPESAIRKLKLLSGDLKIDSNVVFEGPRPAQEMGAYMAVADFLVSPRVFGENVPLKLYTYLASGKPLIATNIASHTQIVTDQSAFLGEATVDGLSGAILEAVSGSDAKKRAQAGQNLVQSKYSREDFRRRLVEAYQKILPLEKAVRVTTLERTISR